MSKAKFLTTEYILNNLGQNQACNELERKMRYYCEPRGDRRMKDKLHIANNMMNRLNIQGDDREEVINIIGKFNLNGLLKNRNQQVIIACICFHAIKLHNSKARLHNYRLFNDLEINENIMITFYTNLYRLYNPVSRPCTMIKECY